MRPVGASLTVLRALAVSLAVGVAAVWPRARLVPVTAEFATTGGVKRDEDEEAPLADGAGIVVREVCGNERGGMI